MSSSHGQYGSAPDLSDPIKEAAAAFDQAQAARQHVAELKGQVSGDNKREKLAEILIDQKEITTSLNKVKSLEQTSSSIVQRDADQVKKSFEALRKAMLDFAPAAETQSQQVEFCMQLHKKAEEARPAANSTYQLLSGHFERATRWMRLEQATASLQKADDLSPAEKLEALAEMKEAVMDFRGQADAGYFRGIKGDDSKTKSFQEFEKNTAMVTSEFAESVKGQVEESKIISDILSDIKRFVAEANKDIQDVMKMRAPSHTQVPGLPFGDTRQLVSSAAAQERGKDPAGAGKPTAPNDPGDARDREHLGDHGPLHRRRK